MSRKEVPIAEFYAPPDPVKEREMRSHAIWLGALFEPGGHCSFDISFVQRGGRVYTYSHPLLTFKDKERVKSEKLHDFFGGQNPRRTRTGSWEWTMKGRRVIPLVEQVEPYAPSRKTFITAALLWEDLESVEERIEIAKLYKNDTSEPVDVSVYSQLVELPEFVAGVLDSRGGLYPDLRIQSQNVTLLRAIQGKFGGAIIEMPRVGLETRYKGKAYVRKVDAIFLELGIEPGREMLSFASPFLISERLKAA